LRPQGGDRGDDIERRVPLVELLRLGRDERLGPLRLAPAPGERLGDDLVELADRRIEVAWDGEIDEEELPAAAAVQRGRDGAGVEHEPRRARRGDDDVDRPELRRDLLRVRLAVRDEGDLGSTAAEVPRRLLAHLAGA